MVCVKVEVGEFEEGERGEEEFDEKHRREIAPSLPSPPAPPFDPLCFHEGTMEWQSRGTQIFLFSTGVQSRGGGGYVLVLFIIEPIHQFHNESPPNPPFSPEKDPGAGLQEFGGDRFSKGATGFLILELTCFSFHDGEIFFRGPGGGGRWGVYDT